MDLGIGTLHLRNLDYLLQFLIGIAWITRLKVPDALQSRCTINYANYQMNGPC